MDGFAFTTEIKVIWRDLDALGHVNNAVYATYFETARMGYLNALNALPRSDMSLMRLILAEQTITYRSPAVLGETLVVGVRVSEIRNSSFITESRMIEKESGRLVATARSVLVHFDYEEGRPKPVPQSWREAMAAFDGLAV